MDQKPKGVIWFIAARPCLKEALELLYENFNKEYRYPVLVLTFGKQYSDGFIQNIHEKIDSSIKFVEIPPKQVPSHIKEEELFYNRKELPYVKKSFPKSRVGYLHTNQFVAGEAVFHPEMLKYDYGLKMDDDTFITGKIDFDILHFVQGKGYVFAPFAMVPFNTTNALQCQIGFRELVKQYMKENAVVPKSSALDENGNWDEMGPRDPTIWDFRMFKTEQWARWWKAVDRSGGIYKYRWGDLEVHTLYLRMYYQDSVWHSFDFYKQGKCRHGGYGPVFQKSAAAKIIAAGKQAAKKIVQKFLP